MVSKLHRLMSTCFIIVCAFAAPALGISVSCSSTASGKAASSLESFNLDGSTSLREGITLGSGGISLDRQAIGTGKNSLKQSLSGTGYVLQNDIESLGEFRVTTSSAASNKVASLSQDVGGIGSMSLNLRGAEGANDAGQEASVAYGSLASVQSLSVGQGISARQSTAMEGLGEKVASGALGEENVVLAKGGFSGQGSLAANLASGAKERAVFSGSASIDDMVILNEGSFEAVSMEGNSPIMGMAGMRLVEGGKSIGSIGNERDES